MTWATSLFDQLFVLCDQAVSGGYMVAVALICALQYVYHLHTSHRSAELKRSLCRQIDEVHKDLRVATRDRTLTSLENQILREFTEELDLDRTLDQLTRRLAAESKNGFAAHIAMGRSPACVTHSRGLTEKARESLAIDDALVARAAAEGVVMLRKSEIYGTRLYDTLCVADRGRFDRLFLAGVGDAADLSGVIVSTALIPCGIPQDEQMELTRRLVQSLGGIVKRTKEIEDRDRQLQSINEIMELRAVTDQRHSSPLEMVEAFVNRLRQMVGADRAVLFLVTPEAKGTYKTLCRCGIPLPSATLKKYSDVEATLAETAVAYKEPEVLDGTQLARIGVQSTVGAAIVAPVSSSNGIAGVLCLTRGAKQPFAGLRPELIQWAARYLSETLLRALHQAVAEWHARQDPLTDLSNRRTFDHELAAALQSARRDGHPCALLMVDIDRFKSVNDRNGHLGGDEVLRCVSRVMKDAVARSNSGGIAARFGGEEFALLLPGLASEEASFMAEAIRAAIEALPIYLQQSPVNVTVSIGVGLFPDHGVTEADLITAADAALYQAKEGGRNRVEIAQSQVEDSAVSA